MGYTVGQRRGLKISSNDPLYVLSTVPEESRVVVGPGSSLLSKKIPLESVSVRNPGGAGSPVNVLARIRSRHPEQPARLTLQDGGRGLLEFEEPVRAAAPGQSAVFFDPVRPDVILGGGIISRAAA